MLMLIIVKLTRTLYKLFNENRHSNLLCKDIDIHLESQSGVLQTQEKKCKPIRQVDGSNFTLFTCFFLFLGNNQQSGYFSINMAHLLLVS